MSDQQLTIAITSFSYKKEFPSESTGHGIGFVFDMRFVDNPGRIDSMKRLSGKDAAVIEYLETQTVMPTYIQHIKSIIDMAIDNYLQRGFEFLGINFGCTGGQHRSVYAAETIGAYLQSNPRLNVEIKHLAQNTWMV